MRFRPVLFATCAMALSLVAMSAEPPASAVQKIESFKDLYSNGDVFLGGQPTLEMLRWLKSQGVTLVVNLRTETENKEFAAMAFEEATLAKELGFTYATLPMSAKEPGTPKTVAAFADLLANTKGKTLLHCASAGRATNLWMAYLVRNKGLSLEEAVTLGRQLKFALPIEDLLGGQLSLQFKPKTQATR